MSASWEGLKIGIVGNQLVGESSIEGAGSVCSAEVGGSVREGVHRIEVFARGPLSPMPGFEIQEELLPTERTFTVSRGRWIFDRRDRAGFRLSYASRTGVFKGSFKVHMSNACCTEGRVRIKKSTAKVFGFIVEGAGSGLGTVRKPALSFDIGLEG